MTVSKRRARWRKFFRVLFVLSSLWIAFAEITLLRPPRGLAAAPTHTLTTDAHGVRHYGRSYLRRHGGVWEIGLVGDPIELGDAHAHLAGDLMIGIERRMMNRFAYYVPSAFMRGTITTLVRASNWGLDKNFPHDHLLEIAAEARALEPIDPYEDFLPTYHRAVTLHALYDIALSFEHSPMIGCSALFASGSHSADGHTYIGRNFDMEVDPVFDEEKAVQLYRPRGKIAFASVIWPGMSGVVTGLNRAGIFVAIHGARGSKPQSHGVPVPSTVRHILESAHTLDEAIAIARADDPMVSHILLVVDGARGQGVAIEHAPGVPAQVRPLGASGGVANHYQTPTLAGDPRNLSVIDHTSTLLRQSRVDAVVHDADGRFDPMVMLSALRDRKDPSGQVLPLGHRGALDGFLLTHSVIADATAGVLWVSTSPHGLGGYERFDLTTMLADEYEPDTRVEAPVLPPDTALTDGTYARWRSVHALVPVAEAMLEAGDGAHALALAEQADRVLPEGDLEMLEVHARALTLLGASERARARSAWERYLRARPSSPSQRKSALFMLRSLGGAGESL